MHQNKHGEYSEAEGWLYDAVYKRDLSQIVDLLERYPDIQPQRYRHPQVCAPSLVLALLLYSKLL